MKLSTTVAQEPLEVSILPEDRIMVLGSCFADAMGLRLKAAGFNVCINPFGTLYNPASIASAVSRLDSADPFTEKDCVSLGAGDGRVCSFSHHTSFARADIGEFLLHANKSLSDAAEFWKNCNKVIITLGTAMVWKHLPEQVVVSNCLKRPASEYQHVMLSLDEARNLTAGIVETHRDKSFIFTVSPVRHMSDGAHANTLSKSVLQLSLCGLPRGCSYFPAYEIVVDELRDYRFYAEDLVHPSNTAYSIVWERFLDAAVPVCHHGWVRENEKAARSAAHITMSNRWGTTPQV